MQAKGIRISDSKGNILAPTLPDVLEAISDGNFFYWSLLYLYASGDLGEDKSMLVFEKEIYDSEKGFFITWDELNSLAKKFYQIIDITIIGCRDKSLLRCYDNDQEMYETCDIVIEMIDSSYWEVFSKDEALINKLAAKFKEIKFLEPDFQK